MSNRIIKIIKRPQLLFLTLGHREWFNWISDLTYLKIAFMITMGKPLKLKNPQTFNEKLQWLKLYDRKPLYTHLVDKYEVKLIVAKQIGEDYIIPTFGVWNHFEDIDFTTLPNQFVLKCTHDSGGIIVCKDKRKFDIEKASKKINTCLKHSFYWGMREWPYKNVKPRIIAEQYMEDDTQNGLNDYKVHCFNGVPKVILVCRDRFMGSGLTEDFFDLDWNHLMIKRPNHPNSNGILEKPKELNEIIRLSSLLSKNLPFARVDFYIINHKVYFGEITFYPASGLKSFEPEEWDYTFGSWIKLPE